MKLRSYPLGVLVLLALVGLASLTRAGRSRQRQPGLTFAVFGLTGKEQRPERMSLVQGEPIRIRLELSRRSAQPPKASAPLRLALTDRRWIDYVELRFFQRLIRAERATLQRFDWRQAIPRDQLAAVMARELGAEPLVVSFTVPPAVSARLKPGRYAVRAAYDTRQAAARDIWRGRAPAQPLQITILPAKAPAAKATRLRSQSDYAFSDQKDFAKAEKLAQRASRLAPKDADAWFSLAQARSANGKFKPAVAAYEKFLALTKSQTPPDPRRQVVQKRLGLIKRRIEIDRRNQQKAGRR